MRAEAPWLEDVPAGWASVPLRYLADVETGSADTQDADPDGEYPFVVRSPRFLAIDHFTHDREAILTPGDGDVGRVFHHLNGKFAVHQRVYVLSNFKGVTGRFAYYAFSSTFRYVTDSGTAKSTVESLRRPMLTSFPLPVPPAHTQGVITDFLDRETAKIDALIAKQRELTKTALEHRDRLILDLITRGKGREPLVDSGVDWIGAMPQHWKTRPFATCLPLSKRACGGRTRRLMEAGRTVCA